MNINGETIASLQESKTQNIDLATTIPLVTNFNGAVEINGVPVAAGSTPQPWPGDFDVVGNVNAAQFKPLGGTTTMFLKGDGSLDTATYLTSADLIPLETKTQNITASANSTSNAGSFTSTTLVKSGGLATEFLKADGTVDNSTYLTSAALTTLETKTQNLTATAGITTFAGDLIASNLIKTGATNIEYLMGDGSTLTQSATSGNSNFYLYDNTNSVVDTTPVSGEVIINSLTNTTATIVYISHVTRDNIDVEVFWKFVNTLTELYLQDQSLSTNYVQYNITAAPTITVGDKIAIPVAVVNSAGTGSTSFGSGHNILVSYFTNNLEVDTRISALETKTQNQTATANSTSNAGSFTSTTLVKSGGLATEFLKANGTVDSSTYLTSAALTSLETKTQNLTAIANTTTNAGAFVTGSLAVSNGTSSTLITTTSGTASLPLILPSIQATTGQILQGSSTGQTSWVASSATDTTQRWISSAIGNDTTGTGTLSAPWATIAKGFTSGAQYPLKLNIRGSFAISTLVLTAANSNTQITTSDGYEAQQSTLTGTIQTSGLMTRLKCSGFTFSAPTVSCLIFDDTQGRHVFDNCSFISASAFPIFVGSTFNNWLNFNNCDFTGLTAGTISLDNIAAPCILRLYNCGVVPITIGTGWIVYISGSTTLVSPSIILGTVVQLPVEQFNAVITTQAAFNAISVDGLYINQVVGITGLPGATFGCSFLRSGAVKLISIGYNSLPASINVLNVSVYNTWVKDPNVSGGWIQLNQSLYLPLAGGTVSGMLTLGSPGIAMTVSGSINGSLIPTTTNTGNIGSATNSWNNADINTVKSYANLIRTGASNSTSLTTAAASSAIPFVLPSVIGSASQFLTTNGSGQSSWTSIAGGAGLKGLQFFNVAGVTIYTPSAGTTRALVICCGGGGAGGGVGPGFNNAYGGGGNAGGQAIGYYIIDETKTGSFTIGSGGFGVSGGAGGGGTNTTFLFPSTGSPNATITALGAFGGGIKQGATDDRFSTANANIVSGTIPGLNAVLLSAYVIAGPRGGYGFSTAGDTCISGIGANSAFGVGGQEQYINNLNGTGAGNVGVGNGSGGGGAISTAGGSASGGNGRLGCVLIYEY